MKTYFIIKFKTAYIFLYDLKTFAPDPKSPGILR